MEIGTVIFYGALGVGVFLIGRFTERKMSGRGKKFTLTGQNDINSLRQLISKISGGVSDYKRPEREIMLEDIFTKRFKDLEYKSLVLSRAVTLLKRKNDDLWTDIRNKHRLHHVNRLSVDDKYTKIKVYK